MFLLEDGEVYTCGADTKGQLGHERKETSRVKWPSLASMTSQAEDLRELVEKIFLQVLTFQGGSPGEKW